MHAQIASNWLSNSRVKNFCQFTSPTNALSYRQLSGVRQLHAFIVLYRQQFQATTASTYPSLMSKRPTDHLEPAAKKRGNDRQLTKDDPSDEDEVTHGRSECALVVTRLRLLMLFSVPGARTARRVCKSKRRRDEEKEDS